MTEHTNMPILKSCNSRIPSIPWSVIAGHERQAMRNHYQTLERLAERGGLSPAEAVAIIEDRRFSRMELKDAEARLMELCEADSQKERRPLTGCAAARDGDCTHPDCPQLRDNEPRATGRHCPLDSQKGSGDE
jgi:hypothetical protein